MLKMVEVVGVSKESVSDAIKKAVESAADGKMKASWFEVVEQRGAIQDGKFKEFQVKVKVAVAE